MITSRYFFWDYGKNKFEKLLNELWNKIIII